MPRLTIVLTKENEEYLRSQLRRQGDISRIINELLDNDRAQGLPPKVAEHIS